MDYKIKLNKKTVQDLLRVYGMQLISFKPVSAGIVNTSVFLTTDKGKYVLRVYAQNWKKLKDIEREVGFMSLLGNAGVPVPAIIKNQQGKLVSIHKENKKVSYYIIMELVPGRHLKDKDYNLIPSLARYQAVMHKQAAKINKANSASKNSVKNLSKYFNSETERANKKLKKTQFWSEVNLITDEVSAEIKSNMQALEKLPHGLVHLDYDSDNIIVNKGRVAGIIDFDDLSNLPFIVDLSNTLWWWAYANRNKDWKKILSIYLKHYQKERRLSKIEISFLPLFMRLRNIAVGIVLEVSQVKRIDPKESRQILEFDKFLKNNIA